VEEIMMKNHGIVEQLIDIFWTKTSDDKVISKSLFSIESEEELPEELHLHFKEMDSLYNREESLVSGEVLDGYCSTLESLDPVYFAKCKANYFASFEKVNFTKVCSINHLEFGYYLYQSDAAVDQYQCVVYDSQNRQQKILAYEGSTGEAVETIGKFLKSGFQLFETEFSGGYELDYVNR
jgi:hypothetical protein